MTAGEQVAFQLTFDDYQAAILAHAAASGTTNKHSGTPIWQWLIIAVSVIAALFIVGWNVKLPAITIIDPLEAELRKNYFELAPWFLLLAISFSYNFAARLSRVQVAVWLGLLLVINLASALVAMLAVGGLVALPFILVLHFWFRAWTQLVTQRAMQNQWRRMDHLHGPKVFRWDHEGFVMEEPAVTSVYRWNAVLGWRETKSVFMLYISASDFHLVPIRAFSDAGSVKNLRDAIMESLKNRADPRFPVISQTSTN